jgi:hypothetical protein
VSALEATVELELPAAEGSPPSPKCFAVTRQDEKGVFTCTCGWKGGGVREVAYAHCDAHREQGSECSYEAGSDHRPSSEEDEAVKKKARKGEVRGAEASACGLTAWEPPDFHVPSLGTSIAGEGGGHLESCVRKSVGSYRRAIAGQEELLLAWGMLSLQPGTARQLADTGRCDIPERSAVSCS